MIQEAYISLELAKMMAKAGFTDRCRCYYLGDDAMRWTHDCQEILPKDVPVYECPTQQMACEWLRLSFDAEMDAQQAYHRSALPRRIHPLGDFVGEKLDADFIQKRERIRSSIWSLAEGTGRTFEEAKEIMSKSIPDIAKYLED